MSNRELAVAGQFYPSSKNDMLKYIDHFNNILDQNNISIDNNLRPKAIIVPHAGYVYSGFTANIAYRYIPVNVKNIIVIGPSHKYGFEGASVALYDKYPTPLGELNINSSLSKELIDKFSFLSFNDKVHREHSTETQFPFIKNYKSEVDVVEIVYSSINYKDLSRIIDEMLQSEENFIVISTDLSHFYDIESAKKLDNICLNGIDKIDIDILDQGCEACGMTGVKAMLKVAKDRGYGSKILDYRTSADTSGDENRVVGYVSTLIHI